MNGGLLISRGPAESITLIFPDKFEIECTVLRVVNGIGSLILEYKDTNGASQVRKLDAPLGKPFRIPDIQQDEVILCMEPANREMCMIRTIADSSIRVLRTELLRPELKRRRRIETNNHPGGSRAIRSIPANGLEDDSGREIA